MQSLHRKEKFPNQITDNRLYEYIHNDLQQPAVHHYEVIGLHSSAGTEIHTAIISIECRYGHNHSYRFNTILILL